MSNLEVAVRGFRRMAWLLSRQRRTLRWRRVQPVGHQWPAVESQQQLVPWGPAVWLPRITLPAPLEAGEEES